MGIESRYFEASDKAKQFVKRNLMVDSLLAPVRQGWPREDMFEEYHDRALEVGIDCIGMTVSGGPWLFDEFLKQLQEFLVHIHASNGRYTVVRTVGDIHRAHENGQHAMFFMSQGCELLQNRPTHFAPLVKNAGVGSVAIAYNEQFRSGDGCLVQDPQGITLYGKQVIDALHANKIILDVSHSSEPTALGAIAYHAEKYPDTPMIYSHSTPRAICDIYRSISDEEIKACAATGGVISVVTLPWFIAPIETMETTPEHIVKAIDYVHDLVGIDHIGVSSDDTYSWDAMWEWSKTVPEMYNDGGLTAETAKRKPCGSAEAAKIYPALVDVMWKRDYSDEDVAKVLGGNLMRVYEKVWG